MGCKILDQPKILTVPFRGLERKIKYGGFSYACKLAETVGVKIHDLGNFDMFMLTMIINEFGDKIKDHI